MSKRSCFHFVYRTTNTINGKFYIGIHSTWSLDDGYLGSGTRLRRSIQKYGKEHFECKLLQFFTTRQEAFDSEVLEVSKHLEDPLCMNLRPGGAGGWTVEQQRKNSAKAQIAIRILWSTDPEWARSRSLKITEANKRRGVSPKFKYDWTGKHHAEKSKRRIGRKNSVHQSGSGNSQYGKVWMMHEERKESMRVTKDQVQQLTLDGWVMGRRMKWK